MESRMRIFLYTLTATQVLSVLGDCTLGRPDLEMTSPNLTAGTFIDITSPASCSGQITQWNYCYYNPQNATDIIVNFQVWRLSSAENGVRVDQTVDVIIPLQTENFRCDSIMLNQDSYINVTEGDYLGVRLSTNTLPLVANSDIPGTQLLFIPASLLIPTVIDSTTNFQNRISNVLHVTAVIDSEETTHPTQQANPGEVTDMTSQSEAPPDLVQVPTSDVTSIITLSSELGGVIVISIISGSIAGFIVLLIVSVGICIIILALCRKHKKTRSLQIQEASNKEIPMSPNTSYGLVSYREYDEPTFLNQATNDGRVSTLLNASYGVTPSKTNSGDGAPNTAYGIASNDDGEDHIYDVISPSL